MSLITDAAEIVQTRPKETSGYEYYVHYEGCKYHSFLQSSYSEGVFGDNRDNFCKILREIYCDPSPELS